MLCLVTKLWGEPAERERNNLDARIEKFDLFMRLSFSSGVIHHFLLAPTAAQSPVELNERQ